MKTALGLALVLLAGSALAQDWKVSSQQTVGGFKFPESAAYDPGSKALYVGNFGGEKLAPAEKDGQGYISKVGVDGKVIEQNYFKQKMNKPKGIWIQGGKLWVTDIDGVWMFDIKSRKGRKLDLPLGFANDPAVADGVLYVTDNRNDKVATVKPADFLNAKNPEVKVILEAQGINPNGVAPAGDGQMYLVGFLAPDKPKGIYTLGVSGQVRPLSPPIGRLDGIHALKDGTMLYTDWNTGSLSAWSEKGGVKQLAGGFKGPADFAVIPGAGNSMTVVVPDLVASTLRFIQIRK
jgi:sugar lactone lactonase YvrE